jgi:hypothetical protein
VPKWWPLVTRRRFTAKVKELETTIEAEYQRATADGNAKVRQWAVDANWELHQIEGQGHYTARVRAVMQHAIGQFRPERRSS